MSKRYGRQQKRKAKAEINRLNGLLSSNQTTLNVAANIIDVARKVSPNSICFKPGVVANNYYRHVIRSINNPRYCVTDASLPAQCEAIKVIDLYELESSIKDSDFERAVHFRVGLGSNVAGYRISKEGLKNVPTKFLVEEIVEHLKGNNHE